MKIILDYWRLNFLSLIEYKTSFFIQLFGMILNDILFVSIWYMFFMKFGEIGGMQFPDFALLMSIMVMVFAIIHIFFGGYYTIGIKAEEGKLDSQLLLPKNLLLRLLTSYMMVGAIGDLLFSFMLMCFITDLTLLLVLKIILLSIFGSAVFLGFLLIFVSLSFYLGSSKNIVKGVFESILGPSHYPPSIFEGTILKYIFMTIIPVFYVIFLPYKLSVDFNIYGFIQLLLASIFFLSLGIFVFYKGIKRYESGNMLNTNV